MTLSAIFRMRQIVCNALCDKIKRISFNRNGAFYNTFVSAIERFIIYPKIELYRLVVSKPFMRRAEYCYILYFVHFKLLVFILIVFITSLYAQKVLLIRGNISLQSCITTSLSFAKLTKAGTIDLSTLISFSFKISLTSLPDLKS